MEPATDQSRSVKQLNDGFIFTEDNQSVIPDKQDTLRRSPVQRDDHGGCKSKSNIGSVMSLRTVDGGLSVSDHGKIGAFEYHHISTPMLVSSLRLGSSYKANGKYPSPTLVPDFGDKDGTKLTKKDHPKLDTPTSETVNVLGIEYGSVLALEYNDDPNDTHARLILIPEKELKQVMEDMEACKPMTFKINPLIKIRTYTSTDKNNVALYFETPEYYYYINVSTDVTSPTLWAEPVKKEFDPHIDFVRHLVFTEILVKGQDIKDGQLDSRAEDKEKDPEP